MYSGPFRKQLERYCFVIWEAACSDESVSYLTIYDLARLYRTTSKCHFRSSNSHVTFTSGIKQSKRSKQQRETTPSLTEIHITHSKSSKLEMSQRYDFQYYNWRWISACQTVMSMLKRQRRLQLFITHIVWTQNMTFFSNDGEKEGNYCK